MVSTILLSSVRGGTLAELLTNHVVLDVLERNQPATDNAAPPSNEESTAPADIQGRPKRQKVSRIDRLNKESEIIGQDLMCSMAKSQGHKRKPSATVNDGLFDIPEDTPINSMAPPTKKQRMALPSTV